MAAETKDYDAVIDFLHPAEPRECGVRNSVCPESISLAETIPNLGLSLQEDYDHYQQTGEWRNTCQFFAAGWTQLEGVMILAPGEELDVDLQIEITATNERALRDLLLSFPRAKVGFFSCAAKWMFNALTEILDGHELPDYDGYCYLGIKRGSGEVSRFSSANKRTNGENRSQSIVKRKDPVISEFRDLASLKGKVEQSKFVVEGSTLVKRAIDDGLPVETVLFTTSLLAESAGTAFLNHIHQENLPYYQANDGLMGAVTTTRPVPSVIASVQMNYRDASDFHLSPETVLLIVDSVANPDNLGMVLRTADAAGVDGVLVVGEGASPFHKNCIRASRGAVGRIPLLYSSDVENCFTALIAAGFNLFGATSKTSKNLYDLELNSPLAFVLGNENEGIQTAICDLCTDLVAIPMAPGQSSLNVGVAAGVLLYELIRRHNIRGIRTEASTPP